MKDKYVITWYMIQIHARQLSYRLLPSSQWKGILAINKGGLILSAMVARELNLMYIDTICISNYNIKNSIEKINIIKKPKIKGNNFILIDDLVNTGKTAQLIRPLYPKSKFVTIFAKPKGKKYVDDYIVDVPQNVWIEQPWETGISYIPPISEH
ncbi:Xanthine phosphoribosyltransferase [Candidatus Annandia adelgestsuga]|uniref:Xanthine phosphoribosyltransferase n=1 Tax=Candidatus Annandia adelgestsuga TaxID=1302411 RepID=A0A3S9J7A3_9ENTR|nr:xanthine phosphoribosyltransferase [Candidatus Annandia adelgestsuga]AZP36159.1 Xanthine phosphoribosyltransferase [Candidatus Annandia adelgestsuga]